MKKCNNLIIKEEYLPQFTNILKNLKPEEIFKFCKDTYKLEPNLRYLKSKYTQYVTNSNNTQSFFTELKRHLRNLKFPVDYNKIFFEELTTRNTKNYIDKLNNRNYPITIYEDFLNYFSK